MILGKRRLASRIRGDETENAPAPQIAWRPLPDVLKIPKVLLN